MPDVRADDWAHGVWTALAVTLAQPLRDAVDHHLDNHGPKGCVAETGGIGSCAELSRLWSLLPVGDQILT